MLSLGNNCSQFPNVVFIQQTWADHSWRVPNFKKAESWATILFQAWKKAPSLLHYCMLECLWYHCSLAVGGGRSVGVIPGQVFGGHTKIKGGESQSQLEPKEAIAKTASMGGNGSQGTRLMSVFLDAYYPTFKGPLLASRGPYRIQVNRARALVLAHSWSPR